MRSHVTGAIWSGAGVWATLSVMSPHYANPDLPRFPLAIISLLIFVLWLAITWILGQVIGRVVLWFKRRVLRPVNA